MGKGGDRERSCIHTGKQGEELNGHDRDYNDWEDNCMWKEFGNEYITQ